MHKVISTNACDTEFCEYDKSQPMNPIIVKSILIKGGTGVCQKGTLFIPNYAETLVSDEDLEFLMKNDGFVARINQGFYKVVKENEKPNVSDMEKKDKSAQLTSDDFIDKDEETDIDKIPESKKRGKKHQVKLSK